MIFEKSEALPFGRSNLGTEPLEERTKCSNNFQHSTLFFENFFTRVSLDFLGSTQVSRLGYFNFFLEQSEELIFR